MAIRLSSSEFDSARAPALDEYEPTAPKHHWSGWYAAYIVARERGKSSDEAAASATLHIEGAGERAQV